MYLLSGWSWTYGGVGSIIARALRALGNGNGDWFALASCVLVKCQCVCVGVVVVGERLECRSLGVKVILLGGKVTVKTIDLEHHFVAEHKDERLW